MSPNGKLDRAALPAPDASHSAPVAFAPPQTEVETALAAIWAEVLRVERVGRHDELFALGADSIHLFQIAARANREGMRLSARQLLDNRTVAEVAKALERAGAVLEDKRRPMAPLRQFQGSRYAPASGQARV
jgi:aryl carrier-like protein